MAQETLAMTMMAYMGMADLSCTYRSALAISIRNIYEEADLAHGTPEG